MSTNTNKMDSIEVYSMLESIKELIIKQEKKQPEPAKTEIDTTALDAATARIEIAAEKVNKPTIIENPVEEIVTAFEGTPTVAADSEEFNPFAVTGSSLPDFSIDDAPTMKFDDLPLLINEELAFASVPAPDLTPVIVESPMPEPKTFEEAPFLVPEPVTVSEDPDKIYFEMPLGMSLCDLALALCEDANGWMDIYYLNQNVIDQTLISLNYTDLADFETDQELFTGLKLEIPTVFTKMPRIPTGYESSTTQSYGLAA